MTNTFKTNKSTNFVPDAKKHLYISLVKSALRIFAGSSLVACAIVPFEDAGWFILSAGVLFVVAEILGIVEELV